MPDDYGSTTATWDNPKEHVFTRHGKQANAFDAADWLGRLAAALEDVAAQARPAFPFAPETPHYGPLDDYRPSIHRQYRDLAARAKHDPAAAKTFAESPLWLKSDPTEARAILREHPLLRPGLVGSGKREGIGFILPTHDWFHVELKSLIAHLAKRAMQDSGEQAGATAAPLSDGRRRCQSSGLRDHAHTRLKTRPTLRSGLRRLAPL